MRYSIITPTIARESLLKTCESIDNQTESNWSHIIMVDVALITSPEKRKIINAVRKDSRRKIVRCGKQHKDSGNTCRWNAYEHCFGDYILFLDDDNVYADDKVLETLNGVTYPWAILPMLRFGNYYVSEPGLDKIDSGMLMHKRGIARYPCISHCEEYGDIIKKFKPQYPNMTMERFMYAADGLLSQYLYENYPYQRLECRPLTVYQKSNKGE